jgi:hypothetical protein
MPSGLRYESGVDACGGKKPRGRIPCRRTLATSFCACSCHISAVKLLSDPVVGEGDRDDSKSNV